MTIFEFTERLKAHLDEWFESRQGIAFKCNDGPADGSHTTKPRVYAHLVPSNELILGNNGIKQPQRCPCILCHIASRTGDVYNMSISIAVKYESITPDETVKPVGDNRYEYLEPDGTYSPDAELEVYKSAVYLQDMIHTALIQSDFRLSNLQFVLPDSSLPEWPYCFCQITFDTTVIDSKTSRDYLLY